MKPFFDIKEIDCLLVAHYDEELECDAMTKHLNFKVQPLLEEIEAGHKRENDSAKNYIRVTLENGRLREVLSDLLSSEALKEAPFYSYCESIVRARKALEGK